MTNLLLTAGFFSLGYFFQSLFGFGAAFIVILGLSLYIPIQPVIGMIPVSVIAVVGVAVLRDSDKVSWKKVLKMFLISLPGVAGGAFVLNLIPTRILVIFVCLLILAYCIYSFMVKSVKISRFLKIPYLLISGFIIGATGLGIVFVPLILQEIENPEELRVSMNLFWLLMGVLRLFICIYNDVISTEHLMMVAAALPIMLVAQIIGRRVSYRIHPEQFQKLILVFLGLIVVVRLISELA